MPAGQTDFNIGDRADEAVADDLRRLVKLGHGALPGAGLPDDVVLLHRFDDGLLLGDGAGEGLLAVDVLSCDWRPRWPRWRATDQEWRSSPRRYRRAPATRDSRGTPCNRCCRTSVLMVSTAALEVLLVQVAGGDYLAITLLKERLGVGGPHHAPADNANRDLVGSRDGPGIGPGGARQDRTGSPGGRKKSPAGHGRNSMRIFRPGIHEFVSEVFARSMGRSQERCHCMPANEGLIR